MWGRFSGTNASPKSPLSHPVLKRIGSLLTDTVIDDLHQVFIAALLLLRQVFTAVAALLCCTAHRYRCRCSLPLSRLSLP